MAAQMGQLTRETTELSKEYHDDHSIVQSAPLDTDQQTQVSAVAVANHCSPSDGCSRETAITAESLFRLTAEEDIELKKLVNSIDSTDSGSEISSQQDASTDTNATEFNGKSTHLSVDQSKADSIEDISIDGQSTASKSSTFVEAEQQQQSTVELRLLVRRREAGALIGKRGSNIKRLRETFRSSIFSIPDTGNGPERVVCIATNDKSLDGILTDITQLLLEKSPENDEQIELKLLIHSSHAGSIIGIGGQSIKKLRNDSKAAIKIYEMCCPLSNERVCAIKAKPPVVVSTIKLIQTILNENLIKGTTKPYDALHFDLNLVDKYGGYLPDDAMELLTGPTRAHMYDPIQFSRPVHDPSRYIMKNYSVWRASDCRGTKNSHESGCDLQSAASDSMEPNIKRQAIQNNNVKEGENPQSDFKDQNKLTTTKESYKEQTIDAEVGQDHRQQPKSQAQPLCRETRYHPYQQFFNPLVSGCQRPSTIGHHHHHHLPHLNQAASPISMPPGYSSHRMHFNNSPSMIQQRAQFHHLQSMAAAGLYGSPNDRCRHDRPCLCMYVPIVPDVMSAPQMHANFVHLTKGNFNYSRNSAYGYKKK